MKIESIPIAEVKKQAIRRPSIYDDLFEAIKDAKEAIKITFESNQKTHSAGFAVRTKMKKYPDFRKCKVMFDGNILYVIPLDLIKEKLTESG